LSRLVEIIDNYEGQVYIQREYYLMLQSILVFFNASVAIY